VAASSDRESDAQAIWRSLVDKSAFTKIFERHYPVVHRYLAAHWGPEAGADLASETFLRAFDQRDRFDLSRDSARPWLFGIARNLSKMEARRRHRESGALEKAAERNDPEDFVAALVLRVDAQQQATRLGLIDVLKQLRPEDLTVLTLSALGEMTHAEIAETLRVPIGTVKSRLHRTITALRELFEPERQSNTEATDEA
jgi:RNA polymerase sigma factor (sigma-70 family)